MSHLKSYWYQPEGFTNFGDEIGRIILEKLGHTVEWAPLSEADIITTGTLLNDAIEQARDGLIVLGSGLGHSAEGIDRFDLRAVRGRLTAAGRDIPTGDLALCAPHFWQPASEKRHRVGIVRHYVDGKAYPFADHEISATLPVGQVIEEITSCEYVLSSSLHGLIIATAYGIPCMRLVHPFVIAGDFKFADFLTSLDRPLPEIQDRLLAIAESL
jgi:pyruvyltransferase